MQIRIDIDTYLISKFFSLVELQRKEEEGFVWIDKSILIHFSFDELEDIVASVRKLEIKYAVSIDFATDKHGNIDEDYCSLSIKDHELYRQLLNDFTVKKESVIFSPKDEMYFFENGCIANVTQGKIGYLDTEIDLDFLTQNGLFFHKLLISAPEPVSNDDFVSYFGLQNSPDTSDSLVKTAKANFKKVLARLKMPKEEISNFVLHPKGLGCRFGYKVRRG